MPETEILSFQDALRQTKEKPRSLLLGNGFSAKHFDYKNLLEKSGLREGSPIRNLFTDLDTNDFEYVVRALENAVRVERSYGNVMHADELEGDVEKVRQALIHAIEETHPKNRDDLVFQYDNAIQFLRNFAQIFSLNYDLLLYWSILGANGFTDGFGRGEKMPDGKFHGPFKEEAYCTVFNPHGGLHLFQNEKGETFKALNGGVGVVATISEEIRGAKRLPLYVAEGSSHSKLKKINSVEYLRYAYRKLEENENTVFIYGHSANKTGQHIYEAIFRSKAPNVYIGIHQADEQKLRAMRAQILKYAALAGSQKQCTFYRSETANVWGSTATSAGAKQ
jgi:hypothetical protein